MIVDTPSFINSPYVTIDFDGWHISNEAPEDLKKQFNEWLEQINNPNRIEEDKQ